MFTNKYGQEYALGFYVDILLYIEHFYGSKMVYRAGIMEPAFYSYLDVIELYL